MRDNNRQPTPDQWADLHSIFESLWDFSSEDLNEFTRELTEIFDCYATHRPSQAGKAIHHLGQINLLVIAVANQYDLFGQMVEIAAAGSDVPARKGGCHA